MDATTLYAKALRLAQVYALTGSQAVWACYQVHQPDGMDLETLVQLAHQLDSFDHHEEERHHAEEEPPAQWPDGWFPF